MTWFHIIVLILVIILALFGVQILMFVSSVIVFIISMVIGLADHIYQTIKRKIKDRHERYISE